MKIRFLTVSMILAVACAMVASPQDTHGQNRRRRLKPKPAGKVEQPAGKVEPAESEEQVEARRQVGEIAKLSLERLQTLRATIDLLQRITKKAQIGGIPQYFLSEDPAGESGKLEGAVKECLKFLPDGIMQNALRRSLQALVDAWILDHAEKTGNVSDQVLKIIDRYNLQGNILIVMCNDVLGVAEVMNGIASGMLQAALK